MYPALSFAVAGYLGLVALLALAGIAAPRLEHPARIAMKAGQLLTLLVVVLDVATLLQGHEVDSLVTHVGYAVAAVALPVVLLTRHPAQPDAEGDDGEAGEAAPVEPPHLAVVAITAVAVAVLVARLQQTW